MGWADKIRKEGMRRARSNIEAAKKEVIESLKKTYSSGKISDHEMSGYSDTHQRRREKKGLQTDRKDLHFSGTLLNSLKEVERKENGDSIEIGINFSGAAHRRKDQRSASNLDVAGWLGEQEGRKILKLDPEDKRRIEQTYKVSIRD